MPKSTTTQRVADPIVGGDRVDEPVGADLARVVDPDRHPGADRRADDQHLVAEVALGHRGPLLGELRHGRGDDRAVDVGERQPAQRRAGSTAPRRARRRSTRARWRTASARRARLAVGEHAEVRLGVADVDDEQHRGRDYRHPAQRRRGSDQRRPGEPAPSWPGPSAASASASRSPPGSVSSGSSSSSGTSTNRRRADLARAAGVRPLGCVAARAEQQQVDVDHPRTVAHAAGLAARPRARPPCRHRAAARARARSRSAGRR